MVSWHDIFTCNTTSKAVHTSTGEKKVQSISWVCNNLTDGKEMISTDIRDALFAVFFDDSILLFNYMSKNLLFYAKYPEMVVSCLISQNTQDRAIEIKIKV